MQLKFTILSFHFFLVFIRRNPQKMFPKLRYLHEFGDKFKLILLVCRRKSTLCLVKPNIGNSVFLNMPIHGAKVELFSWTWCSAHDFALDFPIKGAVSPCNKLFLNITHLLDIHLCDNNNCSKVFTLKKSKIHIRRHFPSIDLGWRPLAHVCLWLHVSSCLRSTRRRYIVSINMASIKS